MKIQVACGLLSSLLIPGLAWAEGQGDATDDSLHPRAIEIGLSFGKALGDVGGAFVNYTGVITYRIPGSGTEAVSAYVGAALTERFLAVAEASFLNGSHMSKDLGGGYTAETYTRALYFDAALEWRITRSPRRPAGPAKPIFAVPYLGMGVGTIQSRSDVLITFMNTAPSAGADTIVGSATQTRYREPAFAPLLIAGVEMFTRHHIGFRCEGRGALPTGSSHDPIGEVTAGIFFFFH
jgi:hypothetical protein